MTDPKQELLALIDRLDPERQAILLQYAQGLEQAGPLLEKWVEEFKIAEKRRQYQLGFDDILDTPLASLLDFLEGPPEELTIFLTNEILQYLSPMRGYINILISDPEVASNTTTLLTGSTLKGSLKMVFSALEYSIALTRLAPLYGRYLHRKQQETDRNNLK